MVFESLVVDLINRYLGDYIESLNASQLNLGLLRGNARLENLDVKANAFDGLNLPVKVLEGHISSLTLKIPFKNLYTEPTVAELDGLYVLVVPNSALRYDESKEKVYRREEKVKKLRDFENAQSRIHAFGKEDDKKEDTFGEKLASQIIKNLQIEINNVHIRYEDSYSIPGRVFSLGVTLHFLVFKTYLPDDHVIATRDESAMEFFKRVNLASLGIYWNHDSALFSGKPRGPLWTVMRNTIAKPSSNTGFTYLLQPISSSATLHIHARPEKTDYTVPRFSVDVDFSEIQLNLALCQYRDITSFLDATDRLMVQNKYRKYRPDISLNNHAKAWWNYAITAILEEHIRRKSRMWSWVHIKEHRRIAKEYITLYKKRLGSDKLTREQQLLLGDYEDALDVFNIVVCRQQAQVQAKKDAAAPKPKGGGIFSWFTRSSTSSDPGSSSEDSSTSQGSAILRRIKSEMTSEEKARLFAAIDYSEASGGGGYPATYVSATASITLRQLGFSLLDEKLKDPHIINFVISKLTIGVEQREGDQALSVKVRLDDLESIGARPSSGQTGVARSDPPVLITSRVAELRRQELLTDADKAISEQQQQLLVFDFAKNPLNRKADQCLFFYADPLQIVYDADTINKIVHFLTPPEELRFNELSTQMLSSLEDVKEITASGLRHMANRRLYTDVQIIIQPSCFILPDTGVYRNGCRLLLVDCGSLTIRSTETRAQEGTGVLDTVAKSNGGKSRSRMIRNATFDELKDDAYDCYEITLSSMQIIMAEEGDDWRALRTKHQSPNHILRPLGINLSAKRCLLQNDINFPKILISGCLPVFSVALMDKVLKSLTELIDNVPFPESNKRLRTPENPDELLKSMVFVPSDDFVTTRDLVRASRFNRSASQSTVGSWISESVNDPEDEQDEGRINPATEQSEVEFSDSNLKRMDPSVAGSGTDGDDSHTQANKTTHNASRDAAAQRRRLANLIDLELDFVIRMIEIQVLQHSDQPSPTDAQLAVLCLTVHEVGAKATKRRWDQELQARIGTLSLSVPRYIDQRSGKAVCLMKTKRHIEGHHLLSVHLLVAEKGAPDFEKRYNNTRHRLRCEFKALELCIHKEATVQLFKFFNNLVDDLVVSPMGQKPDPVTVAVEKIGEKQGLDAASDVALSPDMPQHMTAVEALDFRLARRNERRLIRLDAAAAASKSGRTMVVREVVITQWSIDATLDKVTLLLCSDEVDLASATIHGLRLNMFTCYQTTELSAILSEISIVDNVESTDYRKIMWIDPAESVISMQLTHFTRGSQLPGNSCDPDKLDLALSLQFGKIRVIFLHYFVLRISEFMSAFSIQTRAVLNQVNELSDAAMQQVQEVAMKSSTFRLGLHVVAQAPVIYIPQHSFSNKALMADFGCITYKNRFEFVRNADGIPDVCGPVPEPGLMFEHADVTLENLRLSRAVLMESAVTSEKPVIHPINIELHLRRNLSPESCATVPLLWLDSSVKSIHVSLTQGDYRAIQEVVLDNLAEVPPSTISAKSPSHLAPSPALQSHAFATASPNVSKVHGSAVTKSKSDLPIVSSVLPLMIAVQFSFEMESATLDLLSSGVAEDELQHVSAEPHLALCSLRRFGVSGHVSTDSSCKVNVQLFDIQLTDTRPDAEKKITKVLDRADLPDESEVLLHVEFLQDSSKHQKVHVKLRSLHFCASMDYLMALADFHLKSYPKFEKRVTVLNPITESGKRKRKEHPLLSKRKHRRTAMPPTEYPYDLELRVEVGCPEVVLVEDIYSLDTNSLKLTATFEMQYTMKKDVVIMDATLKGLTIVACPYIEPFRGAFSKEILCPTQLSFYSKQPISSGMQGSLHVDTLLTNINPGTIQLIAHILSSVQSGLQTLEPLKGAKKTTRSNSRDTKRVRYPEERNDDSGVNFWDPVPLDELDLPYLSPCNTLPADYSDQESISIGCDVSKVLEHLEDRSPDKMDRNIIVIRLRTIRVVLESQVGTRSMPMLVLESSVDGEFLSPESDLQVKLTVDLSLSYYNDALSQWEQLLETLPDEDGRMWSLQIEVSTANLDDLVAEEDLDEVGCLQASANTILVVSRDNLELTLTKSALDMLSNLGRSFEAAYNQKFSEFEYELGGELAAPYRIQNRTGWPMALRTDPLLLRVLGDSRRSSIALLRKSFTHSIRRDRGPASSIISGAQNSQALEPSAIGIPTPWEVDQGVHILADGEEMGFIEPERMSRKVLTVRSVTEKTQRHMVWTAWCPSTGTKPSTKYETGLPLHSVGSIMLLLPKHISNSPGDASHSKDIYFPVVAQTTTYLGTRVINLRSTVQIVNDTSDILCLFVHNTSASTDRRINRLAVLEAGEIYAVPVSVINSRESTGIFIGPDVGVTTMSTTAAYWPESACLSSQTGYGRSQDLVYLAPVTEKSASRSSLHTLQPISATLSRPTETTRPLLKWPVQFMQCKSKTSDLTYYYSITTLNMSTSPETHCATLTARTGSLAGSSSSDLYANDFQLVIRNSVILHNQLPVAINYIVSDRVGEISPGNQCTMRTVSPLDSTLDVSFDYDGHLYRGTLSITSNMDELTVCTFESRLGYELLTLHLGVRNASDFGQVALTLYAPYWMINKTGKDLTYKSSDETEINHPASFSGALLFSSLAKSVFGKRKVPSSAENPSRAKLMLRSLGCGFNTPASVTDESKLQKPRKRKQFGFTRAPTLQKKHKITLRIADSSWSDKFSLDTVGSSGRVNCKTKLMTFEIGVKIDLSSSGLTKIVTLMPYFMLVNKSSINLECCEVDDSTDRAQDNQSPAKPLDQRAKWVQIPAGEAVPFWPRATASKKMLLCCRINEQLVTEAFPFYESHSVLMKLQGKYAGIFVVVHTTEEATVITLQLYQEGMALVRIVNHLGDNQPMYYSQRGVSQVHQLDAGMSVMYTWDSPKAVRELVFYCNKDDQYQSSGLTTDCVEEFYVNDTKAYWVSFLWNMQRVLLLTQDVNAAKNARLSADLEKIDLEIMTCLQSVGLSLVDNFNRIELAYVSVTSSGVRWSQVKRGNRLKPLKPAVSDALEAAYTSYLDQLRAGEPAHGFAKVTDIVRPIEVDFSQMMMLKPDQCELRRAFDPGVFVQYKNSKSQMQLHCKIFRFQIDNQKLDCTFPVVLAPYTQPKSVALDSGPKPVLELSGIVARTANPGSFRFKYFRALIQEMTFKLDQGFLNGLFDFFSATVARVPEEEAFQRDYQLVQNRLIDSPVMLTHLQDGTQSIFDNLHISPIKIHVSFSLAGGTGGRGNAFPSEMLNLFLQSIGVALTDVQDVILKLAYFERQACVMTLNQMMSEMTRHYVGQGIRQMYVLVLGLDVLGNPFGVLRGMAQGVEDLFYEPVKGAILGPEEFAEGVALGVKSLFGHAVGGAAGAVSRITGTIGKGVAALTLDEDYKRRRREQMARRPDNFGAGLAQGGRDLFMGFFHGATGVVMQPVKGAKKEGVQGFFKGVGKGLVGAVTRPVSGVVDFASSSFEGIRRIADIVNEIGRIRPPRYLRMDGVVRPYERREAEGHLILRQIDKDAIYGHYVYHITATRGGKMLLLTTSHLLIIECMDLLGTWTVHWQTGIDGLAGVPVVNRGGILITLKEKQKKMFNSGNQTKQFDCDQTPAMNMVHEIDAILSKH